MAELTVTNIFGQGAVVNFDPDTNTRTLTLDITNFQDVNNGGEIDNGLGISNLDSFTASLNDGNNAVALLYAIVILASQNQAPNLNDDPTQSLFISEGGKRLGSGARDGQIQRVINFNLFNNLGVDNLPDIDDLAQQSSAF